MLPGSLDAGRGDLLTSPRATRPDRIARSTNGMSVPLAAMRRVLHVLSVWQERSAGRQALASLDDRLLRDIGLTRADVERELLKSFWRA